MNFSEREKWFMRLGMVVLYGATVNTPWRETFGLLLGMWIAGTLSGLVLVLNFLTEGVRPPALTGGGKA